MNTVTDYNATDPIKQEIYALIQILRTGDDQLSQAAAYSLAEFEQLAVPELVQLLKKDTNSKVRARSAWALGAIGIVSLSQTLNPLLCALSDSDDQVRGQAAFALGRFGSAIAPQAIDPLIIALNDTSSEVRSWAANALGEIGPATFQAVAALSVALFDPNESVRVWSAIALGQIGPKAAPHAIAPLIKVLTDQDVEVRNAASYSLIHVGPLGISALIKTLSSGFDRKARWQASWILGQLIHIEPTLAPAVIEPLIEALNDVDSTVRSVSTRGLGFLGALAAPLAIAPLIRALTFDSVLSVRQGAAMALGQIGPIAAPEAVDPLLQTLFNSAEPELRKEVAFALSLFGADAPPKVLEALILHLNDRNALVRRAASDAVESIRATR